MDTILASLNNAQREAATHIDGALLILAGAGSGKTKTITTRLAYLIQEVGIPPSSTLTLTFTNKAANEMRTRALALLQAPLTVPPLLCTFHRFGLLFLKFYIHHLGRAPTFNLLDTDDQKRVVKKLSPTLLAHYTPAQILGFISSCKNQIISPKQAIQEANSQKYKDLSLAYEAYDNFLQANNMLDFDDLLLLSYHILCANEQVAREVSMQYNYIMVDEYQDTNYLQIELLRKLCSTHNNLCVVGDDDQSIYSWRGADVNYILNFSAMFAKAHIIKLQENYRSKEPILRAANALIAHNHNRLGKDLISTQGDGEQVELISSENEVQEADTIATKIQELISQGESPQEIAILFRLNALSRSIEEGLNRARIPYRLIGATRFYERAEVKNALAYFRLILDYDDNFSLERIINIPRRGIGKVTQDKILATATHQNLSVHKALTQGKLDNILSISQKEALTELFATLDILRECLDKSALDFLEMFDEKIDLLSTTKNTQDDIDRRANIEELYGYFRDYILQNPHLGLDDFLNDLSLSSGLDVDIENSVCCMSVHSSKGLEFSYVFIVGLEEGFFPLVRDESDIQEERRLAYVAFTRAKNKLFLSNVHSRFYKGRREELGISRFVREAGILPNKQSAKKTNDNNAHTFAKGDVIKHKIFGMGIILAIQDDKLTINFGGNMRSIMQEFVQKV